MRHKSKLLTAVLDGVSLPATVFERHSFRRPESIDLSNIRHDVVRVGELFSSVIEREQPKKKPAFTGHSAAAE